MIGEQLAKRTLGWTPEMEPEFTMVLNSVIAEFEKRTGRLWKRRADHVYDAVLPAFYKVVYLPLYPIEEVTIQIVNSEGIASTLSSSYILTELSGRFELVQWFSTETRLRFTITGGYGLEEGEASLEQTHPDVVRSILHETRRVLLRDSPDKIVVEQKSAGIGMNSVMVDAERQQASFERACRRYRSLIGVV